MSSAESIFPPELQPGSIIQFADITEVHAFEDMLAPYVEPELDQELWAARMMLKELLRPEKINNRVKFNGRITNLAFEVMEDPYERLLDARERGWILSKGTTFERKLPTELSGINRYIGFRYSADAMSSGRGKIGQVQAELWYGPNSRSVSNFRAGVAHKRSTYTSKKTGEVKVYEHETSSPEQRVVLSRGSVVGYALLRAVTKPKIETEKFIELQNSATTTAFSVMQQQMQHPLTNGMRK